jgi:membrane protease YdiL (CAAX protease family)
VIQARLAASRRAALLTSLVLGAAALRALLLPLGDAFSTAVFAACLLAVSWIGNPLPNPPHKGEGVFPLPVPPHKGEGVFPLPVPPHKGEGVTARLAWSWPGAVMLGVVVGALLISPAMTGRLAGRPLGDFWSWAAIAAIVATLEETAIRGVLYRSWLTEGGPLAAVGVGAIVFALIHLPRYGVAAMPLDFAVGLALGGLRAITGRVMPCAVAHTIADWGAWFWA